MCCLHRLHCCVSLHCPCVVLFLSCSYPHLSPQCFEAAHNSKAYGELGKATESQDARHKLEGEGSAERDWNDVQVLQLSLLKRITSRLPGGQSEKRTAISYRALIIGAGGNLPRF